MTRINWAVIVAAAITVLIAAFTALAGEPYNQASLRAMIVVTTVPLALVFSIFIVYLIRGRGPKDEEHPRGRPIDVADLFGAGVSMLAIALGLIFLRSTFFGDSCGPGTDLPCYGIVSAITVLFGGGALILKLFAFSLSAITARRKWWMLSAIIIGIATAIATFWHSVSQYWSSMPT